MPKRALENLTESMFYVLMAYCHADLCGIDAANYIQQRSGGAVQIGPATLYTILAKFEKQGYLKEIESDGRKRIYQITELGREAYQTELLRLRRCLHDAETEGGVVYESKRVPAGVSLTPLPNV